MLRATVKSILLLMLAVPALDAQRTVERGWPLAPSSSIKLFNYVGTIRVVAWDRDSLFVTASIPQGLSLFGGGDRDAIKVGIEGVQNGPETSAVLVVMVPAAADVWIRGAATDIVVERLIGDVDIASVSGDIIFEGSPRNLSAETMGGNLTLRGSPEILRATTASGTLHWTGSARDARISSVTGNVKINSGPLGRTLIETVSGEVTINASLSSDARVTVETHGGDVELILPLGTRAQLVADVVRISGAAVPAESSSAAQSGKRPSPRTVDLNHKDGSPSQAHISVRSFKGALRVLER